MDNNNRQLNEQVKKIVKRSLDKKKTIQEHKNTIHKQRDTEKMKETEIWKLIIGHLKQTSIDIYSVSILVYLHCWSAGSKVPCRRQIQL